MPGLIKLPQEPTHLQSRAEKRETWERLLREHPAPSTPQPDEHLDAAHEKRESKDAE